MIGGATLRTVIVAALLASSPAASLSAQRDAEPRRPNVLLVMTDDQGLGDFGSTGNNVLDTPALDAFARQCPQVDRFYVCPVCSPTRASLMTGRYHYRTRVVDTWIGRSMMDPDETTVAEVLGRAGYRSGIFGKWHLGDCYPLRAIDQGFDEALVHRGGGLAQPSEPIENRRRYTDPLLEHNGELVPTKGYCTDVYFAAAQRFVEDCVRRRQPFFAYVATNAPHGPFHDVPEDLLEKYRRRDLTPVHRGKPNDDRLARIFAMIENIDQNFGRLLARLDQLGVADDTIVVFLTDNGPVPGRFVCGLRGSKSSVYEGGIRSPLWVRWPERLSPKTRVTEIAAHIDVLPTICDAVGVPVPAGVDGRSLLPLLAGETPEWPERELVLQVHRGNVPHARHHFAVVGQRWKLVRHSGFGRQRPAPEHALELFDLARDPAEQRDLSGEHPDVVARLTATYDRWFADVGTTRPDNFAPPRIHVGAAVAPRTVLTRQDWRPQDGEGWGHAGVWLLHVERPTRCDVELRFREPVTVERVVVEAGVLALRHAVGARTDRVRIADVALPAGDVGLQVVCHGQAEPFAPYHVVITARD